MFCCKQMRACPVQCPYWIRRVNKKLATLSCSICDTWFHQQKQLNLVLTIFVFQHALVFKVSNAHIYSQRHWTKWLLCQSIHDHVFANGQSTIINYQCINSSAKLCQLAVWVTNTNRHNKNTPCSKKTKRHQMKPECSKLYNLKWTLTQTETTLRTTCAWIFWIKQTSQRLTSDHNIFVGPCLNLNIFPGHPTFVPNAHRILDKPAAWASMSGRALRIKHATKSRTKYVTHLQAQHGMCLHKRRWILVHSAPAGTTNSRNESMNMPNIKCIISGSTGFFEPTPPHSK